MKDALKAGGVGDRDTSKEPQTRSYRVRVRDEGWVGEG